MVHYDFFCIFYKIKLLQSNYVLILYFFFFIHTHLYVGLAWQYHNIYENDTDRKYFLKLHYLEGA